MSDETVLPTAEEAPASGQQTEQADPADLDTSTETTTEAKIEEEPAKKEKTAEEREIARLRKIVDRRTKRIGSMEERLAEIEGGLRARPIGATNETEEVNSEPLSLSRAELQRLVTEEARKLAPSISEAQAEIEHRRKVVDGLAKSWGQEKFDALAEDLDAAFGGLTERNGKPKAATEAIFESDAPQALIEYLADPDHTDEAEAIGRMSAVQATRAITKLETKLAQAKAADKPQPSKAAAPIEAIRGSGTLSTGYRADMSDAEFATLRARQKAQRR